MPEKMPKNPFVSPDEYVPDPYESAIFAAELGGAPSVDLHGLDRHIAKSELETFFHSELVKGTEAIKIIHGRGDQILRNVVIRWLNEPSQQQLIAKFRGSQNPTEQGAVIYVALHRLKG